MNAFVTLNEWKNILNRLEWHAMGATKGDVLWFFTTQSNWNTYDILTNLQ